MNNETSYTLRPLRPEDLGLVVEIDSKVTGHPRKIFFEKRLQAALADTRGFIAVGVETENALSGFAIARIQSGEFGKTGRAAVLDVIGVDPELQNHGLGAALLSSVEDYAHKFEVDEIRTQIGWEDSSLLKFFAEADFQLSSNQVLERSTA